MKLIRYIRLLIVLTLCGCATKPVSAPSTAAMDADRNAARADLHTAQTATQQADAKAQVILQYIKSTK